MQVEQVYLRLGTLPVEHTVFLALLGLAFRSWLEMSSFRLKVQVPTYAWPAFGLLLQLHSEQQLLDGMILSTHANAASRLSTRQLPFLTCFTTKARVQEVQARLRKQIGILTSWMAQGAAATPWMSQNSQLLFSMCKQVWEAEFDVDF